MSGTKSILHTMYTVAGVPTRSWSMSLSSQLSEGVDRQPNPLGAWMIVFSSPAANCGLPFTTHTAWWRWTTSTRGTVPFGVDELGVESGDVPGLLREEVRPVQPDDVLPRLHRHGAGSRSDAGRRRTARAESRRACSGSADSAAACASPATRPTAPPPRTEAPPPGSELREPATRCVEKERGKRKREISPDRASMRHRPWSTVPRPARQSD